MSAPQFELLARKERLDVSKIFLAYLATCGDVVATADVAECGIDDVLYLAKAELWDTKLVESQRSRGSTREKAQVRGREINRMANYIQSIRLRSLIDKTIQWIYENEENITKFCQETNKQGVKVFSTKPLVDLAKAAEAVQAMTYRSLGDAIVREEGGIGSLGHIRELHLTVIEAMKVAAYTESRLENITTTADQSNVGLQAMGYLDVEKILE